MKRLKTNTAVKMCVGPFLDATDGVTPEVALTVANTACTLVAETDDDVAPTLILDSVAGNDATNPLTHITNDGAGYYYIQLTAANVNRLGRMSIAFVGTAHGTVFHELEIVPAMVYNSEVLGTDVLQADVTQWLGTAAATPTVAGVPEVDVTHWLGAAPANARFGTVRKNTAITAFPFQMFDSTNHAPATGKTVTVTRSIDGAAFGAGTLGAVTEIASGWYECDFGAGDVNGDTIIFKASAAACDDTCVTFITSF